LFIIMIVKCETVLWDVSSYSLTHSAPMTTSVLPATVHTCTCPSYFVLSVFSCSDL